MNVLQGHIERAPGPAYSLGRVGAVLLRHLYLLRSSWTRTIELVYWPAVQMLTWGFVQSYVMQHSSFFASAAGSFIGALLLWDILLRSQQGFTFGFMEEMWARNLGNMLISPLTIPELLTALALSSILRLAIGLVPVTLFAIPMFGFNIFGLGLPLAVFFANLLLFGWAIGVLASGLIMRHGLGAEALAWSIMFLIMPFACIYYPVGVLPWFVQPVAWALPATWVFEGMRAIMIDKVFRADLMAAAFGLNVLYVGGALTGFMRLLEAAKRHGSLMQTGE